VDEIGKSVTSLVVVVADILFVVIFFVSGLLEEQPILIL
jgi:hypothetical protein